MKFDDHRITQFPISGSIVFVLGSALAIWSNVTMAKVGKGTPLPLDHAPILVTQGPYAYVRNPMVISGVLQVLGIAFYMGRVALFVYLFFGILCAEWIVKPWEEKDLEKRFGESYKKYRSNVHRWIPRISAYKGSHD